MATHRTRTRTRVPQDRRGTVRQPHPDAPIYDTEVPPAAPPPEPRNWRDEVVSLSGLNVLAGIWLIIAPWVLNYHAGDPKWNDVVFGAIVAVGALLKIAGAYRATWISILNAAIGVWLFVSAFWLDQSWTAGWNDIILGVIVFVLAIGSASASERPHTAPTV